MRKPWIFIGIALAGIGYFIVDPSHRLVPKCPFYTLTHLYCPGCGSQRAVHALVHGDFSHAVSFNPLLVISLVYLIIEGVIAFANRSTATIRPLYARLWTPWIVFAIVMIFWILRNIPVYPFSLLAPH